MTEWDNMKLTIAAFALAKAHAFERDQLQRHGIIVNGADAAKWREIAQFVIELQPCVEKE